MTINSDGTEVAAAGGFLWVPMLLCGRLFPVVVPGNPAGSAVTLAGCNSSGVVRRGADAHIMSTRRSR